jgi:MFS family permease
MLRALSHPVFRVIWACFLIGQGGFWLSQVTVQVMVIGFSGGDALKQGLLVLVFFAPQLFVSPIAGVLADRYDRVRMMALAQMSLGVVAAVLAALTLTGHINLPALFILSGALGLGFAVIGPTGLALVGQAVPRQDLNSAVALQSVAQNLARVAGPALAVPVVFFGGPQAAFAGFAVLAAVTAMLLWRLQLPERPMAAHTNVLTNLAEGWAHARARPPTMLLLSMVLVGGLFGGPFVNVLGPVLAVAVLHAGANGYFILVVASGAGAALGALATGFQLRRPGPVQIAAELLVLGISLIAVALVPNYLTLVIFTALYGAIFFALMASIATSIQHAVAEDHRGRVVSLYAIAWGGAIPPGALVLGYLAHTFSPRVALILAGGAVAAYAVAVGVGVLWTRRSGGAAKRTEPAADAGCA